MRTSSRFMEGMFSLFLLNTAEGLNTMYEVYVVYQSYISTVDLHDDKETTASLFAIVHSLIANRVEKHFDSIFGTHARHQ